MLIARLRGHGKSVSHGWQLSAGNHGLAASAYADSRSCQRERGRLPAQSRLDTEVNVAACNGSGQRH